MARITVEDCIDKFPSRFELVLVAAQRAKKLYSGEASTIEKDNDKNTVIALREISEVSIPIEGLKENLIQEFQTITINDEEDENIEIEANQEGQEKTDLEANQEPSIDSSHQIEEEIKKLSNIEDSDLKEHYEISENPQTFEDIESSKIDEQESTS